MALSSSGSFVPLTDCELVLHFNKTIHLRDQLNSKPSFPARKLSRIPGERHCKWRIKITITLFMSQKGHITQRDASNNDWQRHHHCIRVGCHYASQLHCCFQSIINIDDWALLQSGWGERRDVYRFEEAGCGSCRHARPTHVIDGQGRRAHLVPKLQGHNLLKRSQKGMQTPGTKLDQFIETRRENFESILKAVRS